LAVTLTAAVAGLVLVPEDVDLRATAVIENLGGDGGRREGASVGGDSVTVDEEEDGELKGATRLDRQSIDDEDVADLDLLLAAACADDGIHRGLLTIAWTLDC